MTSAKPDYVVAAEELAIAAYAALCRAPFSEKEGSVYILSAAAAAWSAAEEAMFAAKKRWKTEPA